MPPTFRSTAFAPWSRGCTTPASRSSSTSSTTTPARAIISGPTLSFRGIDNTSYYWLSKDQPRYYENFTGTGNALNLTHPRVLQMVMDSLRYWVEIGHVDGFRFDLATTLGRGPNGFDPGATFFAAIRQDPVLAAVKLIAEPWDVGLGRLSGRPFPARLVGMERPLSADAAAVLERRRRQRDRRCRRPDDGLEPISSITMAAGRAPASITSPFMTASPSPIW